MCFDLVSESWQSICLYFLFFLHRISFVTFCLGEATQMTPTSFPFFMTTCLPVHSCFLWWQRRWNAAYVLSCLSCWSLTWTENAHKYWVTCLCRKGKKMPQTSTHTKRQARETWGVASTPTHPPNKTTHTHTQTTPQKNNDPTKTKQKNMPMLPVTIVQHLLENTSTKN